MQLRCDRAVWREMAELAADSYPVEACALLGGTDRWHLSRVIAIGNEADAADRYRMDPLAVCRAEHALRTRGLVLCGVFHAVSNVAATTWSRQ